MSYIKYFIFFVLFFIIIYALYYMLFVRKQTTFNKDNVFSDLKILMNYYKIDVEKIGYQKVLRILCFINSLMLSLMVLMVINIEKTTFKLLILLILMIPSIWVVYYFLAKYLKHLEGKMNKNV